MPTDEFGGVLVEEAPAAPGGQAADTDEFGGIRVSGPARRREPAAVPYDQSLQSRKVFPSDLGPQEPPSGPWDAFTTSPIRYLPPGGQDVARKVLGSVAGGTFGDIVNIVAKMFPKTTAGEIARGVSEAATDQAEFFTSPMGIATLRIGGLPKLAQRAISLAFAGQMASQAPELSKQLTEELKKPDKDVAKISRIVASGAATIGFAGGALAHGLMPGPPTARLVPPEEEAVPPVIPPEAAAPIPPGQPGRPPVTPPGPSMPFAPPEPAEPEPGRVPFRFQEPAGPIQPKPPVRPKPPLPRQFLEVEVPESGTPERDTIADEIRRRDLRTVDDIRSLWEGIRPISAEEAREWGRQAWGEWPPSPEAPRVPFRGERRPPVAPPGLKGPIPLGAEGPPPPVRTIPEIRTVIQRLKAQLKGKGYQTAAGRAIRGRIDELNAEIERIKNAVQKRQAAPVFQDVRTQPGGEPEPVPAEEGVERVQPGGEAEAPPSGPAEGPPTGEVVLTEEGMLGKPLEFWEEIAKRKLPPGEMRRTLAKSLTVPDSPLAIQKKLRERIAEIKAKRKPPEEPPPEAPPAEPVKPPPPKPPAAPTVGEKITKKQLGQIYDRYENFGTTKEWVNVVEDLVIALERRGEPVPPGLRQAINDFNAGKFDEQTAEQSILAAVARAAGRDKEAATHEKYIPEKPATPTTPTTPKMEYKPTEGEARWIKVFRKMADTLQKQIEDKRRPMTQNPTPKRMREYNSRLHDADNLERVQKALRALADAREAGTVPEVLDEVSTKEEIHRLVRKGLKSGGYYDVIPDPEYADKSAKGKALQAMIGKETPEQTAARQQREKADELRRLEEQVRFSTIPGFFPTPKALGEVLVRKADIRPGQTVLEPSAGKGDLADVVKERHPDAKITTVERMNTLQQILKAKGYEVAGDDALAHTGQYDRIVMNPPFEKGQDMQHVMQAFDNNLKPGGKLVALMAPIAFFKTDRGSLAFQQWFKANGGKVEDAPEGAFKGVQAFRQTGVRAKVVTMEKTGERAKAERVTKEPTKPKPGGEVVVRFKAMNVKDAQARLGIKELREAGPPGQRPKQFEGEQFWAIPESELENARAKGAVLDRMLTNWAKSGYADPGKELRGRTQTGNAAEGWRLENYLKEPAADVSEQKQRLKILRQKREGLNTEYAAVDREYKRLEQLVMRLTGPRYLRGRIKASARASDIKAYRDAEQRMAELRKQMATLDDLGREDQKVVDRQIDAEIINDPKQPLLRRIDRKIRLMEPNVPEELLEARNVEERRVIKEKYPDATVEEMVLLGPDIERAIYFYEDPWKDPQVPNLQSIRRGQLQKVATTGEWEALPEDLKKRVNEVTVYNKPVSPADVAALTKELSSNRERITQKRAEAAAKTKQAEREREAREREQLKEAEKVAASVPRSGRPGGRPPQEVKSDLINRLERALKDIVWNKKVKMEDTGEPVVGAAEKSYVATSEDGGVAFGDIEEKEGGRSFKVVVSRAGDKESKMTLTARDWEQALLFVKAMAADAPGHVIFGIPGNGVFKIVNSGKNLLRTFDEARRLKTSPGGGPTPYTTQGGVTKKEAKEYLKEAADLAKQDLKKGKGKPPVQPGGGPALGITPQAPKWLQESFKRFGRSLWRARIRMENTFKAIPTRYRSKDVRHVMDQVVDAADNKAELLGEELGNRIAIGHRSDMEQIGAAAVLVTGFNPSRLPELLQMAQQGNQNAPIVKEAIQGIEWAMRHYDVAEEIAQMGKDVFDFQLQDENIMGINTLHRENYLPGVYNRDLWMGNGRPFIIKGGGVNLGTAFMKGKTYQSPFHAIADGYVPEELRLDVLARHRVQHGQRLMNRVALEGVLRPFRDPTDNKPIVRNIPKTKREEGPAFEDVPTGYVSRDLIPGGQHRIAVHEGYSDLFDALLAHSKVPGFEVGGVPVGRIALEAEGALKNSMLLFDTFHSSRVFQRQAAAMGIEGPARATAMIKEILTTGHSKGLTLIEFTNADLDRAVRAGEITQDMADYARANRLRFNMLVNEGMNVGQFQDMMYSSIVRAVPIAGDFNRFVFDKQTRSAMTETALHVWDRIAAENPGMKPRQIARKISRDINRMFGNLGRQGILKDPTYYDLARLVVLAPGWVNAMASTEIRGMWQAGVDPVLRGQIPFIQARGTLGRSTANGLLAYFVATQGLNLLTTAMFKGGPRFTWQNDDNEGHKLDAWIPMIGQPHGGNGFFISPFTVFAELTHDLLRYARTEPDVMSAMSRIAANKMSPLGRATDILRTGRDWDRQKVLGSWNRVKAAAWSLLPLPIAFQPPVKQAFGQAQYPGQFQRQLTASAGFKTEPAESPGNRMSDLARSWLEHGPPRLRARYERELRQEFGQSEYKPLRLALIRNDFDQARRNFKELLKTKKPEDIYRAMRPLNNEGLPKPFTGSFDTERFFVRTLNPQQRQLYRDAVKERIELFRKFQQMIREGRPSNN